MGPSAVHFAKLNNKSEMVCTCLAVAPYVDLVPRQIHIAHWILDNAK